MLYLVATPIGNLEDVTHRALRVLGEADVIAAEDTRQTRKLLSRYQITTRVISYHEHSGQRATDELVRQMCDDGISIALVTDAGTPGISDPGHDLVVAAIERGVTVVPIPGATAVINALVASGLPSARFVFEGFLPRTKKSRIEKLVELASEPRTVIYYESPERLSVTLSELSHACGDSRRACVARELTKVFEEFRRGELSELRDHYAAEKARGECVIVVEGAPQNDHVDDVGADENDTPDQTNDLIKRLATATGINRQDIYRAIAELKRSSG